jgi:hypothetical protein
MQFTTFWRLPSPDGRYLIDIARDIQSVAEAIEGEFVEDRTDIIPPSDVSPSNIHGKVVRRNGAVVTLTFDLYYKKITGPVSQHTQSSAVISRPVRASWPSPLMQITDPQLQPAYDVLTTAVDGFGYVWNLSIKTDGNVDMYVTGESNRPGLHYVPSEDTLPRRANPVIYRGGTNWDWGPGELIVKDMQLITSWLATY